MIDESVLTIIMLSVAVLLPLIPAFILFKFLPRSTGEVSGPLQGLTVKFGGAFAAYLILFLVIIYKLPESSNHYHTWTIVGKIDFSKAEQETLPNINDVFIRAVPPRLSVLNDGTFQWEVAVGEDKRGQLIFPFIQLDLPGYQGVTLPLGRSRAYGAQDVEITYDDEQREVRIAKPIILKSTKLNPAYVATPRAGGAK